MLTLWAVFNILFFLDVSSAFAEILAFRRSPARNLQPPRKMGMKGWGGHQKNWGFKAPPWLEDPGPSIPPRPPLSSTFDFTLAGPCLPLCLSLKWAGLSCKPPIFSGLEELVSEKLEDSVSVRLCLSQAGTLRFLTAPVLWPPGQSDSAWTSRPSVSHGSPSLHWA